MKKTLFFAASVAIAVLASAIAYNLGVNTCQMERTAALAVAVPIGTLVFASGFVSDILPQGALFMAINLKNVKKNAISKNIAGLQAVHYYALKSDIAEYPAALRPDFEGATSPEELVTIPDDDPFVMKAGKFFHKFPSLLEEGQVKSTMVGPIGSHAFEQMAGFAEQGTNNVLAGVIAYVGNDEVIVIAKELNGSLKVVGNEECGAQVDTYEATNGKKTSDGNTQSFGFKAYSPVPCPTYLGSVPLDATDV